MIWRCSKESRYYTNEFYKGKKGRLAAKGFVANGLNCGLNSDKNKNDLALVYSKTQCQAAAVYTTNKVKGASLSGDKGTP